MRRPRNAIFDHVAPVYDLLSGGLGLAPVVAALAAPGGSRVLDLGGGTGRLSSRLARRGARPVVVDASLPMLHRAARKSIPGVRARAERLPFSDGTLDRVAIVDALHHMADLERVAAEVTRVLRPGGSAVLLEPDPERFAGRWVARFEKWAGMQSLILRADDLAGLFLRAGMSATVERTRFHLLLRARKPEPARQR